MEVLANASQKAKYEGYYCFKCGCVKEVNEVSKRVYEGKIVDEKGEVFSVNLDLNKNVKSSCNCKQAFNRRVVCKHVVALYFKLFPAEAKRYYDEYLKPPADDNREIKKRTFKKNLLRADRSELIDYICELMDLCTDKNLDKFLDETKNFK